MLATRNIPVIQVTVPVIQVTVPVIQVTVPVIQVTVPVIQVTVLYFTFTSHSKMRYLLMVKMKQCTDYMLVTKI